MAARHLPPVDAPHHRGGGAAGAADARRSDRPRGAADRRAAHGLRRRRVHPAPVCRGPAMVAKFLPYLKAHRWQVAWALAQVFLIAGFELLKPWPLQIVIDYVLGGKPPPGIAPLDPLFSLPAPLLLLAACIGLVILNLGAGALTLLHNYTTIRVGQNMVNDLRSDLYAHLQRLSLAYHSRQRVGDLGGAGFYEGGGGTPPLYGRQPRKSAGNVAALQLANALFRRGQHRHRWRHGGRGLCRRTGRHVRHAVSRAADHLRLLPRAALRPHQQDHPELGPYRRRARRGEPRLRGLGYRA